MRDEQHTPRRSVQDWLDRAHEAANASEAATCFDRAAERAEEFFEWLTILRAVVADARTTRDRIAVVADEVLVRAVDAGEVWGFRDVANARAKRLDDTAGAQAALLAAEEAFRGRATPGYVWVLLAEGWEQTLGDRAAARRCIDRARASGTADDLCAAASALVPLGELDQARTLVVQAERLADGAPHTTWTIANTYRSVGQPDEAARVLRAALDAAGSSDTACTIARACASHEDGAATALALVRAGALAASAEDWLAVAETTFDLQGDAEAVRRALHLAEVPSSLDGSLTPAERHAVLQRVGRAFAQLLGDHGAARSLVPDRRTSGPLATFPSDWEGWPASESALLDWLRERVDDERLERIAALDYGTDTERHLAALRDIVRTGDVPAPLDWHPGEVLALGRWASGERVDHLERALCCTLLCRGGRDDGLDGVVPQLVESALALGQEVPALAAELLAWCCRLDAEHAGDDGPSADPAPLLGLALFAIAADPDDPRLPALVDRLTAAPDVSATVFNSVVRRLWDELVDDLLVPVLDDRPALRDLLDLLDRPT